jgi:hypothetical protein
VSADRLYAPIVGWKISSASVFVCQVAPIWARESLSLSLIGGPTFSGPSALPRRCLTFDTPPLIDLFLLLRDLESLAPESATPSGRFSRKAPYLRASREFVAAANKE